MSPVKCHHYLWEIGVQPLIVDRMGQAVNHPLACVGAIPLPIARSSAIRKTLPIAVALRRCDHRPGGLARKVHRGQRNRLPIAQFIRNPADDEHPFIRNPHPATRLTEKEPQYPRPGSLRKQPVAASRPTNWHAATVFRNPETTSRNPEEQRPQRQSPALLPSNLTQRLHQCSSYNWLLLISAIPQTNS